jgi:hypothetical protein
MAIRRSRFGARVISGSDFYVEPKIHELHAGDRARLRLGRYVALDKPEESQHHLFGQRFYCLRVRKKWGWSTHSGPNAVTVVIVNYHPAVRDHCCRVISDVHAYTICSGFRIQLGVHCFCISLTEQAV